MQQTYIWDVPVYNFSWHTKYLFTFSVGVLTPSKQMWGQCLTKAMIASFQILMNSLVTGHHQDCAVWNKGAQLYHSTGPPEYSRCHSGDLKQIPCWRTTNIRHNPTKSSCNASLAPQICVCLIWSTECYKWKKYIHKLIFLYGKRDFENRMVRVVFIHTRKLHSKEYCNVILSPNIISVFSLRRVRCKIHLMYGGESKIHTKFEFQTLVGDHCM